MSTFAFHQWRSLYAAVKANHKEWRRSSVDAFYMQTGRAYEDRVRRGKNEQLKDGGSRVCCNLRMLAAECLWFRAGCPYYKVYPDLIMDLALTDMHIDCSYFAMPQPAIEIRLPKVRGLLPNNPQAALLCNAQAVDTRHWDGMTKLRKTDYYMLTAIWRDDSDVGHQTESQSFFPLRKGTSLEDQFENVTEAPSMLKNVSSPLWRVLLSVAFFGTSQHELVKPDIPRKHIDVYHRAQKTNNREIVERIEAKARGWIMGGEIDLPEPTITYHGPSSCAGRELSKGHLRRGHMRLQPHGPKNENRKLIFIRPTWVRPDLPTMTARGYRLGRTYTQT